MLGKSEKSAFASVCTNTCISENNVENKFTSYLIRRKKNSLSLLPVFKFCISK